MKSKSLVFTVGAFCLLLVIALMLVVFQNRVDMSFAKKGVAILNYNDNNTVNQLSEEELTFVKSIFHHKIMYCDSPSCGFSETVSIEINETETYCIARDGCPKIYWKEKNRYFNLTEEEQVQLYNLLSKYGFSFPCV